MRERVRMSENTNRAIGQEDTRNIYEEYKSDSSKWASRVEVYVMLTQSKGSRYKCDCRRE